MINKSTTEDIKLSVKLLQHFQATKALKRLTVNAATKLKFSVPVNEIIDKYQKKTFSVLHQSHIAK